MNAPTTIVLRNGTIVDGTGAPARTGDVVIESGKITTAPAIRSSRMFSSLMARMRAFAPASATRSSIVEIVGSVSADGSGSACTTTKPRKSACSMPQTR